MPLKEWKSFYDAQTEADSAQQWFVCWYDETGASGFTASSLGGICNEITSYAQHESFTRYTSMAQVFNAETRSWLKGSHVPEIVEAMEMAHVFAHFQEQERDAQRRSR